MRSFKSSSSLAGFLLCLLIISLCGCAGLQAGTGSTSNQPLQALVAIDIQPQTIVQGQSASITWQATNASAFTISPPVMTGALPMSGSATITPTQTTTYTATATDANGKTATQTITVTVVSSTSTPAVTMSIQPPVVAAGQTATLTWNATNATALTISPSIFTEDQTTQALSGSATIVPTADTTYTATATGSGGATATTTAAVKILSVGLTASPTQLVPGQAAALKWTSTNAAGLSIDQGVGAVNGATGSVNVSPHSATTYTITAVNGAATATAQATITTPLAVTLSASPANIIPGGQSTLAWNSQGASTLSIDQGIGTVGGPSGTAPVSPAQTTTYTITATDAGGNQTTAQTTVTVSATGAGLQTVKHIIFMLQENRSFDSYFSNLGAYAAGRGILNYQINSGYDRTKLLPLIGGGTAHPFHEPTVQTENLTPSWDESHFDIDQQSDGSFKMDRFALTTHSVTHSFDETGLRALGFYDETDLPYYYEMAAQFATSDSFHSPVLANTIPNRQFMFCATSQGRIFPSPAGHAPWTCPTIFSSLQTANVSWEYFYNDGVLLAQFQDWNNPAIQQKVFPVQHYLDILARPTADQDLPSVIFIESGSGDSHLDEHPDNSVQPGAAYVKSLVDALMNSPAWHDSVFILAYDEGGGLYDHVSPFTVVAPDDNPPQLKPGDLPGDFTLSGFRVPLIVVSPWVKPHFVSHTNRDLTSILKLIETRFSLPSLTRRDAAADDMTEFFDFTNPPTWLTPPALPAQPTTGVANPKLEAPPQ
jgi:phospholipase C